MKKQPKKILGYTKISDIYEKIRLGDEYSQNNGVNWQIMVNQDYIRDNLDYHWFCGNQIVFDTILFRRPIYKKKIG